MYLLSRQAGGLSASHSVCCLIPLQTQEERTQWQQQHLTGHVRGNRNERGTKRAAGANGGREINGSRSSGVERGQWGIIGEQEWKGCGGQELMGKQKGDKD